MRRKFPKHPIGCIHFDFSQYLATATWWPCFPNPPLVGLLLINCITKGSTHINCYYAYPGTSCARPRVSQRTSGGRRARWPLLTRGSPSPVNSHFFIYRFSRQGSPGFHWFFWRGRRRTYHKVNQIYHV